MQAKNPHKSGNIAAACRTANTQHGKLH